MAKPQQPELHRNDLNPTDQDSWAFKGQGQGKRSSGKTGPVPEDNRPGRHPEQEQDKPQEDSE